MNYEDAQHAWDDRAKDSDIRWTDSTSRSEADFNQSGRADAVALLSDVSVWLPREIVALEIGCGAGRVAAHMSRQVRELWGTDVSGEMLTRARGRMVGLPGVRLVHTPESRLDGVPDDHFDFCYSIFTFECIGTEAHIAAYLREARRVLKPGGLFKFQVMGVYPGNPFRPHYEHRKDTWFGVPFSMAEVVALAEQLGFEVLASYHAKRVEPPSRDRCVDAEHRIWVVARKGDGMDDWERAAWTGGRAVAAHAATGDEVLLADPKMTDLLAPASGDRVRFTPLYQPADAADAIAMVEAGRARGARLMLVSRFHFWWFDYYPAFASYLAARCRRISEGPDYVLISLDAGAAS